MYGRTEQLEIGSGVFVGPEGTSANHHFVPTAALSADSITPGHYRAEVYATLIGKTSPILLHQLQFELNAEEVEALRQRKDRAVFFLWDQEKEIYRSRIDVRESRGRRYSVSGSGAGPFSWE